MFIIYDMGIEVSDLCAGMSQLVADQNLRFSLHHRASVAKVWRSLWGVTRTLKSSES